MLNLYLWLKTLHILSVIIWFSGMLWLPWLMLRQLSSQSPEARDHLAELTLKMQKVIITPAMILTLVMGVSLVVLSPTWLSSGWLHAKLLLVVALTGQHGWLAATRRRLSDGSRPVNAVALQRMTWLPLAALAMIVVLVVVKPF